MKKDYYSTVISVLGAILVVVTSIVFLLLNTEKTSLEWWALSFALIAEITAFSSMVFLEKSRLHSNKVFIKSGIYCTVTLYLIAAVLSSIFVGAFENNDNSFITLQIVIIAIAVSVGLLFFMFSQRISKVDQKIVNDSKVMETCIQRVNLLLADAKNSDYSDQLGRLKDSISYIDKVGSSTVDDKLLMQLEKLEKTLPQTESTDTDITNIIDELCTLLAQRKIQVAESKRGGF